MTYGTDGERPLEQGFENVYPIDGNQASIHLRCFDHVKCDMLWKLKGLKVDKDKQNEMVGEVLGREYQGKRQKGVVDCEDEAEMEERLANLKAGYPKEFVDWLETKIGRVRSLQETIKKCMLKPVRTAAGLGDPPNKYDNQRSESFNNVLKEEMGRKAVDQVHLHELVEERIVKDRFEELTKAIYGMGEYRLAEDYMRHAIEPIQWTRMSPEQRREYIKKTLGIDEASRDKVQEEGEMRPLSVQPDNLQLNVPTYKLQEIWKRAELIQGNYKVLELENNNVCVTEFDKSFTVNCKPAVYECTCPVQRKSEGLCQHVLVVAEKRGKLKELVDRLQQDCQRGSKNMIKNLPGGAGDKPGKARRGKNNIETRAITNLVDNQHTDIKSPKPPMYTEFYHNDQPFEIGFIKDHKRALKCESCSCDFPRRMPLAPYDLCLVHQERYKYPETDDAGVTRMKLTHKKMAKRFYCLRKECILQRHPYFWIGLMQPQPGVRIRLTDSHKKLLEALFGYILPNNYSS